MSRLQEYLSYHFDSAEIGDIDPQNAALTYVADRFELNMEQRYWLAFLFGCTYCAPTVFYIYNEFPDFENVDVGRLQRWWNANKQKCIFQTDRLRIKTQNKFVETFQSYKNLIGTVTQEERFALQRGPDLEESYRRAYMNMIQVKNFGRFTMFIYLELVHELTNFKMSPIELDVKNALSSRNGLCYALGLDHFIDKQLTKDETAYLEYEFKRLVEKVNKDPRAQKKFTAWSVETSLCAYKKFKRGKRYVGYYIDRQYEEITKMEKQVNTGVDWSVLWDHRREYYQAKVLKEFNR